MYTQNPGVGHLPQRAGAHANAEKKDFDDRLVSIDCKKVGI